MEAAILPGIIKPRYTDPAANTIVAIVYFKADLQLCYIRSQKSVVGPDTVFALSQKKLISGDCYTISNLISSDLILINTSYHDFYCCIFSAKKNDYIFY